MRVLFSGGGTGGHIYPALAVIGGVKKRYPAMDVLYVGTRHGLEAKLVPRENIEFQAVNVTGMKRKISFDTFVWASRTGWAVIEALKILHRFQPRVVVGTGGYVCGPVIIAAAVLRIPIVLHEQNAFPGKTNRWLAPMADKLLVTFPESKEYFGKHAQRAVCTGLPVREEILTTARSVGARQLNVREDKLTIFVVGGSQGAKSINDAVFPLIEKVGEDPSLQLIWATGDNQYAAVMDQLAHRGINVRQLGNITIKPYIHHVAAALAVADLVISRAGATFLAEITGRGIASILIPYPYATDNHQEYNAKSLERRGAAKMILDSELHTGILLKTVTELLADKRRLAEISHAARQAGRPDALANIISELEGYFEVK